MTIGEERKFYQWSYESTSLR